MLKKKFAVLFALAFLSLASFAQNEKNNLTKWEHLEISGTRVSGGYNQILRYYRNYNYLTSEATFVGQNSLEWMKESGWELVGVVNNGENPVSLFFKRPFNETRTANEIARLKNQYETEALNPPPSALTDLDEQEFDQKLVDFNKGEGDKLRADLERITNLPLKIISVKSNSGEFGKPFVGAEIVLNATSVLLKDGRNYRSSEAEKYLREAAKRIGEAVGITPNSYQATYLTVSTKMIAKNFYKPVPIGDFFLNSSLSIKISVIITSAGQPNIVAQAYMKGNLTKENAAK